MDPQEIIECMESTAPGSGGDSLRSPMATSADIRLWRDRLMRFLEEIEGDCTVQEIREALEDYRP